MDMLQFMPYALFIILILLVWYVANTAMNRAFEQNETKDFALNASGTFIIKISLDNKIIDVNETFLMYTNYEKDEIINKYLLSDLVQDKNDIAFKNFLTNLYSKGYDSKDIAIVTKDNKVFLVNFTAKAFKNKSGSLYYVIVGTDCNDKLENMPPHIDASSESDVKMLYRELAGSITLIDKTFNEYYRTKEAETRHKFLADSINIGMVEFNLLENNYFFSDKCKELFFADKNFSNDELRKHIFSKISSDDYYNLLINILTTISSRSDSFKFNFRFINPEGSFNWFEFFGKISYNINGDIIHLAGTLNDITSSRIYQTEIEKLAYYDDLTGLYNRTYMQGSIDTAFKMNPERKAAFIYLDIDDFKFINDSFGHYFGDKVICEISNNIKKISNDYMIGRFSGDEIAIFIPEYISKKNLIDYIELLRDTLREYNDEDMNYSISASIGISLAPEHGTTYEDLLKCADIAMNRAKEEGKNKYLIFNDEMNRILQKRILLEKELKKAIYSSSELKLFLQPQFDISTGNLSGFETLTRWENSVVGNISPDVFIPLAEETRLIIPLGKWILEESCYVLKKLQNMGYKDIKISVNLSPIQLMNSKFLSDVESVLAETEVDTSKLEFEITETALMENFEINIKKLYELKKLGISIALDDFGTGYSSLTYLKLIPMTTIKIDKSFIDNVVSSDIDRKITQKIIELSHVLNFKTIAEGVETFEQLEFIKNIGCDIVQGFIAGKPIFKTEILPYLTYNLYEPVAMLKEN